MTSTTEDGNASLLDTFDKNSTENFGLKENKNDDFDGAAAAEFDSIAAQSSSPSKFNSDAKDINVEKELTSLISFGKFNEAVDLCLNHNLLLDALNFSLYASSEAQKKVKIAYLETYSPKKPYARLLSSVFNNNLTEIVEHSDLSEYKTIIASIVNHGGSNFKQLFILLGSRFNDARKNLPKKDEAAYRRRALYCFLIGSSLENAVSIWLEAYKEAEKEALLAAKNSDSTESVYDIHVRCLQDIIMKITTFTQITHYSDPDYNNSYEKESDWKLHQVYELYKEYANIAAESGLFFLAKKFIELLPPKYSDTSFERERIIKANSGNLSHINGRLSSASSAFKSNTIKSNINGLPRRGVSSTVGLNNVSNPYAPAQIASPKRDFVNPSTGTINNGLQNTQAQNTNVRYNTAYNVSIPAPPVPVVATPESLTHSLHQNHDLGNGSVPPPPKANGSYQSGAHGAGWNDIPQSALASIKRQTASPAPKYIPAAQTGFSAPNAPPVSQGSFYRSSGSSTPVNNPASLQRNTSSGLPPIPPPPTTAELQQQAKIMSPSIGATVPSNSNPNSISRKSSFTTQPVNPYAPPAENTSSIVYGTPRTSSFGGTPQPQPFSQFPSGPVNTHPSNTPGYPISNVSSPYASSPVPTPNVSNQYAPSAPVQSSATQNYAPVGQNRLGQTTSTAPPNNKYAPSYRNNYSPSIAATQPAGNHQPQGQGQSGFPPPPPRSSVASQNSSQSPVQKAAAAPVEPKKPKHPAGDRSHISEKLQPIYTILAAELERVKPLMPPAYEKHIKDCDKRLNILFDRLNNDELPSECVELLLELVKELSRREYARANDMQVAIATEFTHLSSTWVPGVRRLISITSQIQPATM